MEQRTVRINVGRGYDVHVGQGLLKNCGELIAETAETCRIAVITDSTVEKLYLSQVMDSLKDRGIDARAHVFPAGEGSKNLNTLAGMLEFLAENQFTRKDCIVALGGGVTGDMAGFAAGCYMRGIRFIQMPTTLLAAVDSSVGGKTAINLSAGKNLAGLFLQPSAVLCDPACLATLPAETLADGAAEAIKTAVLFDEELFTLFEKGTAKANLAQIITRCVQHKGRIVEEDEFEQGSRKLLNLGHTVGHAIEKLSNFTVSHGHAVAIGMAVITAYAQKNACCEADCLQRLLDTLKANQLPVWTDYRPGELAEAILADKKRAGGKITLILPKKIGECVLVDTEISTLENILTEGMGNLACALQ